MIEFVWPSAAYLIWRKKKKKEKEERKSFRETLRNEEKNNSFVEQEVCKVS